MRIGYAKLGRSMKFNPDKFGFQGDAEAVNLLSRLAARNPDVTWVLIGRNDAGNMFNGTNIENPWQHRSADDIAERKSLICTHGHTAKTPRTAACEPTQFERKIIEEIAGLDGVVLHAGQSGTSHMHLPQTKYTWKQFIEDWKTHATRPYDWAFIYGGYLLRGLNELGNRTNGQAKTIWLVTDPRNYLKARDLKWPTGCDDILGQYRYTREQKHERFLDNRTPVEIDNLRAVPTIHYSTWNEPIRDNELWLSTHRYRYAGLETMMLPNDWFAWGQPRFEDRYPIGVASTSYADTFHQEPRRSELIRDYVLNQWGISSHGEIYGKWDKKSLEDVPEGIVQLNNTSQFQSLLERWRVTLALPVVGSSWTVAKVYQCFAARTACFMVGRLDDQGWLLPSRRKTQDTRHVGNVDGVDYWSVRSDWKPADLSLASWLRVDSREEFKKKSLYIAGDKTAWLWIVEHQRDILGRRWLELEAEIERKLGIGNV